MIDNAVKWHFVLVLCCYILYYPLLCIVMFEMLTDEIWCCDDGTDYIYTCIVNELCLCRRKYLICVCFVCDVCRQIVDITMM